MSYTPLSSKNGIYVLPRYPQNSSHNSESGILNTLKEITEKFPDMIINHEIVPENENRTWGLKVFFKEKNIVDECIDWFKTERCPYIANPYQNAYTRAKEKVSKITESYDFCDFEIKEIKNKKKKLIKKRSEEQDDEVVEQIDDEIQTLINKENELEENKLSYLVELDRAKKSLDEMNDKIRNNIKKEESKDKPYRFSQKKKETSDEINLSEITVQEPKVNNQPVHTSPESIESPVIKINQSNNNVAQAPIDLIIGDYAKDSDKTENIYSEIDKYFINKKNEFDEYFKNSLASIDERIEKGMEKRTQIFEVAISEKIETSLRFINERTNMMMSVSKPQIPSYHMYQDSSNEIWVPLRYVSQYLPK